MGGYLQVGVMINIILSGNFAVLNHLTIIPALACLGDECWPRWLRSYVCDSTASKTQNNSSFYIVPTRRVIDTLLLMLISSLSVPVVTNLLQWGGSRQLMNASFDRFRLVNTYRAFGSVGKKRYEAIISVSHDGMQAKILDTDGTADERPWLQLLDKDSALNLLESYHLPMWICTSIEWRLPFGGYLLRHYEERIWCGGPEHLKKVSFRPLS